MASDPRVEAALSVLVERAADSDRVVDISHADMADALRAADAAGWQPIETAPTNVSILVFIPDLDHYGPGIYRAILVDMGTGRRWHATTVAMGRDLGPHDTPTHWRPLPTPPGDA